MIIRFCDLSMAKGMIIKMKKNKFTLLTIILFMLILSGCMGQEEQQPQQQTQKPANQEKEKDSTKLKKIQDDVEAMIAMLSGIPVIELKKSEEQDSQGGGEQSGQSQDQQGGQSGTQQSQGSGQQQGNQQNKPEKKSILINEIQVNWVQALKDVQKIHIEWSDYIAQAAKDGVSKNNIDSFDNTLNQFTNLIIMKKKEEAVIYANNLTLSLINFWGYYKIDFPIDVLKIKYFIRNVIFYSAVNKWDKVIENYNLAKTLFQTLRATSEKEQQEKINKIDFAIQELEKVIKMNDYPLIRLKGKIAIDNLKEMEKKKEE